MHFRVNGPIIAQIQSVFVDDWQFATGELLDLPLAESDWTGRVIGRVLVDGPDDNHHKLKLTMIAAINAAQKSICIATPYFVPDKTVQHALHLAVLRGVSVQLLVPERNNLKFVGWAMRANTKKLMNYGIEIFQSPAPFDHSKLFVVDDHWCLVGSSNWDSRSLELNFEINLECYDSELATLLMRIFTDKLSAANQAAELQDDPLLVRLRNNFFRLFSPYL